MKKLFVIALSLLIAGCATGIDPKKYNDHAVSPESFSQCHGYSCTHKTQTGFTRAEWGRIAAPFKTPAKTPEAERSKIGHAIAEMERVAGAKTGTSEDHGEAVGIKESDHQLDCIDETVNTTQYISMLQHAKLLKFYEITEPTHRGYIIDGRWPHNTAVIREVKTGRLFAVDSFYRANGQEPYIVTREAWLAGWRPPGAKQ